MCLEENSVQWCNRALWVDAPHLGLRCKFDHLRSGGVEFNMNMLRPVVSALLFKSSSTVYSKGLIDARSNKVQKDLVDSCWIQKFYERFCIVCGLRTGKLWLSRRRLLSYGRTSPVTWADWSADLTLATSMSFALVAQMRSNLFLVWTMVPHLGLYKKRRCSMSTVRLILRAW